MENVYWACAFVLAGIAIYRFGVPWMQRFDAENARRRAQQEKDKSDPAAHIRHTLEMAEEQVEPITEIKVGDTVQYLFEAEVFLTRDEAEEARMNRVGHIARRFYADLPHALAGRGARAPLSARERAAQKWKRTFH